MVVQGSTRRLSKLDAATELEVSPTTIDRMIARGELQTEQEARGSRYKVWVLLPEDENGSSRDSSGDSPSEQPGGEQLSATDKSEVEELISLRLQVKNLEDLSNYRGRTTEPGRPAGATAHGPSDGQPEEPGVSNPGA